MQANIFSSIFSGITATTHAEWLKIKRSRVLLITFLVFAIAPMMAGMTMFLLQHPTLMPKAGMLRAKTGAMSISADWGAMMLILTQAMGVGGVLVFGFVASWLFGREYTDGTAKDLLALPMSRSRILQAKFLVYGFWCAALAVMNLCVGVVLGLCLRLSNIETLLDVHLYSTYFLTTLLTMLVGMPVAVIALVGKGYLAPLGFVSLTLVLAQILAAVGVGAYFPWSVPGLYSGAAGEYKDALTSISYGIVVLTALLGYVSALRYWQTADHVM